MLATHNQRTPRSRSAWSRRAPLLMICLALVVLSGRNSHGQAPDDTGGLTYFKNFFVTGNYITAGVDFGSQSQSGGLVTGTIQFVDSNPGDSDPEATIPADADVVGAFLYWQTIVGSEGLPPFTDTFFPSFRGYDLRELQKAVHSVDLVATFSPCWSGGGGSTNTMVTYRADVRRILPYLKDEKGLPVGKALINNQSFEVKLPDNGTGNQTPQTAGASLVIIYRIPTETLKSVVLYDGLQLKPGGATPTTTYQTLRGFYDATSAPAAKLSMLVGSGAKNATELVKFGGYPEAPLTDPVIATNPFFTRDNNSPGSDRAWNGPTWNVGAALITSPPLIPSGSTYGEQVTVTLTHTEPTPYDCLATSAIVFSTEVVDTDFDGLLDVWESSANPLTEPNGQKLPDLKAMGADSNIQDIFVELAFMDTTGYDDPLPGTVPPHTHLPSQTVLDDIAAVFQAAGDRRNPSDLTAPFDTKSGAVKIHFDVGNRYQTSANVIKFQRKNTQGGPPVVACNPVSIETDCFSRGGERLDETAICAEGEDCSFPGFHGVVGWKRGFQFLKEPLFDDNRRHMFRFVLWAHAFGLPREDDTTTTDDESKWPKSISGASDAGDGGGDFVITLGQWDNNTGTEFVQKSTFVHEFGHTAGLRHGGQEATQTVESVNCKPSYQSSMNYLFQIRGLIGPTGPVVGYSNQDLQLAPLSPAQQSDLNEDALTETALRVQGDTTLATFPTRWYARKSTSLIDSTANTSASTRHCDGSPLRTDEKTTTGVPITPMVRVDGTYPIGTGAIDWNANGVIEGGARPDQDINYSGNLPDAEVVPIPAWVPGPDAPFQGWNDWQHLDLRQVGARRVPGGLSIEIAREDLPESDPILGDWGYGDGHNGDWGYGDWGYGDWGYGDWGYGDWGYGDWGYGDWGYGAEEEMNEDQARSQGPAPNSLRVVSRTSQAITLEWRPPTGGGPLGPLPPAPAVAGGYEVWKATGQISGTNLPDDIAVGLQPANVCTNTQPVVCRYVDSNIQTNGIYQYFIVAAFESGQRTRSEVITSTRR